MLIFKRSGHVVNGWGWAKWLVLPMLCIVLHLPQVAVGQQMYQLSQFMLDSYVINPALVGTYNFYQVRTHHRFQWVGIEDAPMTNAIAVYGPHSQLSMGYGGMFYNDITGPTSRTGLLGSFGYNIPLTSEIRISGGISLGFMVFRIDASKFDLGDNSNNLNDPALLGYQSRTAFTPAASVGLYLYSSFFYVGASASQLFGQRLQFYSKPVKVNQLRQTFYLHGGYLLYLTDDFELEPALVLKLSWPSPFQFDLNAKVTYKNRVWGGISYRLRDAVSFLVGYKHNGKILFGYSFDLSHTSFLRFSGGSHELMIGYQFDKSR